MAAPANSYILRHIYSNIPKQILIEAFQPSKYQCSLDERILGEVVAKRVLMDTNLIAGRQTEIPIAEEWMRSTRDGLWDSLAATQYNACFFYIPPEFRENRNISAVIRLVDTNLQQLGTSDGSIGGYSNYGNSVSSIAAAMVGSRTLNGLVTAPEVMLESANFIKVLGNYPNSYFGGLSLECILEFDTEFNNADQNTLYQLRELALVAVKAYIWTTLVIQIDTAEISAGMQIGVFKEIVDGYASANDEYEDRLMRVRGASLLDENNLGEFIRMQV